jgi:hypothetical protein
MMLIARASNGMMILGVDAENIKRLKQGKPILKALSQFGGVDDVLIIYGETLDDIKRELEEAIGPLPEPQETPLCDG